MKITIIGAGNIGTAMAADIARRGHAVTVFSSRPERWNGRLLYEDSVTGRSFTAGGIRATSSLREAAAGAQIIFLAQPAFLRDRTLQEIAPYLEAGTAVGCVPGSGGAEFLARRWLPAETVFFGFDRVPFIARVNEYGRSVSASRKACIHVSAVRAADTAAVSACCSDLLDMDVKTLPNYLNVTFTPSNQLLHAARLCAMAAEHPDGVWTRNPKFYGEWTDRASELLLNCDADLHRICAAFPRLDLSGVTPLRIHYESPTAGDLTRKLRSIASLAGISSPMVQHEDGWHLDLESRYFMEDMDFGLCLLCGFADLTRTDVPAMDTVLKWYGSLPGKRGSGKGETVPVPVAAGFRTADELQRFYEA